MMHSVVRSTPSIVVEDVDCRTVITRLDFRPSLTFKREEAVDESVVDDKPSFGAQPVPPCPVLAPCISPTISIRPEVEAYVTPLSLCHQPVSTTPSIKETVMVISGSKIPPNCLVTSGSESSFTSVDIGVGQTSWNSWNDSEAGHSTVEAIGCCLDLKMGLKSVGKAIAGSVADPSKCAHHRVDITEMNGSSPSLVTPSYSSVKKGWTKCSMLGVFFIIVAIIGLIAVGIAMYIEFVTKPDWTARSKASELNATNICDFLLDSCDGNGTAIAPVNHTDIAARVRNETGKVAATFSTNFKTQVSQQLSSAKN